MPAIKRERLTTENTESAEKDSSEFSAISAVYFFTSPCLSHQEAVPKGSGAIHRTQYIVLDKSDRYNILYVHL
jgi:hypothetical protein